MKLRVLFLTILVALVLAAPVGAQSVSARLVGFDPGKFPTVRAFVSVTDAQGHAVTLLHKEDFKIVEDGADATVLAINASQEPIHVGLVIDHSGSMQEENKLEDAKAAASSFVDNMRAQDEAFVTMFDDNAVLLQDFTTTHPPLTQAISTINIGGGTALYDAVYVSAQKFESRQKALKKALIVLTDGLDNREAGGGFLGLFGAGSKHTLDETINQAKKMQVTLYTIGLGSDADQARLQQMADQTGGHFYPAPSGDQLKAIYNQIAEQLQKDYAVDFNSPRPRKDGTQRHITITVTLPGGSTQTVNGLYVAGFLFNRIHTDWAVAGLLALVLLTLGVAPTAARRIFKPRAVPVAVPPMVESPSVPQPFTFQCPRCGNPLRPGARFCGKCGQVIAASPAAPPVAQAMPVCPNCKSPVRVGAKFCPNCRTRLG